MVLTHIDPLLGQQFVKSWIICSYYLLFFGDLRHWLLELLCEVVPEEFGKGKTSFTHDIGKSQS